MPPLRASQIDASDLSTELHTLLNDQVKDIFKYFKSPITSRYQPEINALLDTMINGTAIMRSSTTHTLKLQNLVYRNRYSNPLSRSQKLVYVVARTGAFWAWQRLNQYLVASQFSQLPKTDSRYRFWLLVQRIELLYRSLSLVNFIIFLSHGVYRSLLDRALGIRLDYFEREMTRVISYEFMNRQLVWDAFTVSIINQDFTLTIMPIIRDFKFIEKARTLFSSSGYGIEVLAADQCYFCFLQDKNYRRAMINLQIPFITNCGHIYCYYCVKSNMMSGNAKCPRCGELITEIKQTSVYFDAITMKDVLL